MINKRFDSDKYIYINENTRYIDNHSKVVEGGLSRNYALMKWVRKNIKTIEELELSNNIIKNIFSVYYMLLTKKTRNIIFQYTTVGVPLHNKSLVGRIVSMFFLFCVKYSAKYNNIIFDIADLKYEQSVDLEININKQNLIKDFEFHFFKLPVYWIFASNSMQEYACKKYGLYKQHTDICINGGDEIKTSNIELEILKYLNNKKVTYVYSGSLNKGRQIEQMVDSFPGNQNIQLILMGVNGEWLSNIKLNQNIIYLGAIEEEKAHYIVSNCDIGLIPYDDNRLYYNIAYPTKLSFYITAGITFLSTPVKEVKIIQDKYKIGYTSQINNWNKLINEITKDDLEKQKLKIDKIKKNFYWDNIFKKNKFII